MSLFTNTNYSLANELNRAAVLCGKSNEEEGGVILVKGAEYEFIKIRNLYAGSKVAIGLYETEANELKTLVIPRIADGWQMYASFHTHPACGPHPSQLDLGKLFQGFKYNYIFASQSKLFSLSEWMGDTDEFVIYYMPLGSLNSIITNEHH